VRPGQVRRPAVAVETFPLVNADVLRTIVRSEHGTAFIDVTGEEVALRGGPTVMGEIPERIARRVQVLNAHRYGEA